MVSMVKIMNSKVCLQVQSVLGSLNHLLKYFILLIILYLFL